MRKVTSLVSAPSPKWTTTKLEPWYQDGVYRDAPNNNERAMVAQQFDWEDQIQDLNLTKNRTANLAQIEEVEDAEEQMNLQIAFMVSTTSKVKECCEYVIVLRLRMNKLRDYKIAEMSIVS